MTSIWFTSNNYIYIQQPALSINGAAVERISSTKFLRVHIREDLSTCYTKCYEKLKSIINQHWHILQSDTNLSDEFRTQPQIGSLWSINTASLVKKAQQRPYSLCKLKAARASSIITCYTGAIENILIRCITVWGGS